MATTKKTTSATAARKAPAQKVATAPETKTPETPKDAETPEKPADNPADNGANGNDGLTPEEIAAAKEAQDKLTGAGTASISDEDLQKLKDAAYKDGYAKGFEDALDGGSTLGEELAGDGEELEQIFSGEGQSYSFNVDRLGLVLLAVKVPENHRKGGLDFLVDRLEKYFENLDPDDRHAGLIIANAIADKTPEDIASARFELLVNSALQVLNGIDGEVEADRSATDAQAAADRLENLAMPEELEIENDPEADPETDLTDPLAADSAAARLRQAL